MFEKLLDFLLNFVHDLLPISYVNQWEEALLLRFGKFKKVYGPGLVFKIPFADKLWQIEVITQTVHLHPQTLTTKDEYNIVLKSIVRYHVSDSKKYLLNVMHASDVLVDTTQGIIRDIVEKTDWCDLENVNDQITISVSEAVKNWGIEVERVTLTDLGIINTYRIMSDTDRPVNLIKKD